MYPYSCGCWDCCDVPATVAIALPGSYSPCCDVPSGTFTVGAATNTILTCSSSYRYDDTLHERVNTGVARRCDYNWDYKNVTSVARWCHPPIWNTTSAGATGNTATGIRICDTKDKLNSASTKIGEYLTRLTTSYVHLTWKFKPSPRRILCLVYRQYTCKFCDPTYSGSTTADSAFQMETRDVYEATPTYCGSLPSTINFTARYASCRKFETGGAGTITTTSDTVDYGYRPGSGTYDLYTFTACPAQSSVSLTYV